MPSWNSILGSHQHSIKTFAARTQILASNLANSDTPGYKARDLDFKNILANYQNIHSGNLALHTNNAQHLSGSPYLFAAQLKYRVPQQSSLDGNTVETQIEKSEFLENAMRYQTSLSFISSKFKSLLLAIRGE